MIKILSFIVSLLGSTIVYLLASYFLLDQINFFRAILGLIVLIILIVILRTIFTKERPDAHLIRKRFSHLSHAKLSFITHKLEELNKRKFASGHVARVLLFGLIYYSMVPEFYYLIGIILVSIIVGFSRVILKKHTKVDILFGLIVGVVSFFLSEYISLLIFS